MHHILAAQTVLMHAQGGLFDAESPPKQHRLCSFEHMKSLAERFEEAYEPEPNSGCWLWTKACHPRGYGSIGHGRRTCGAHRVSYELHIGPIPAGMFVCHKCDNPPCVNPDHLFLGTTQDNTADKMRKGRHRVALGSERSTAKLTESVVAHIRSLRWSVPHIELARMFGVNHSLISRVMSGKIWKHVNVPSEAESVAAAVEQRRRARLSSKNSCSPSDSDACARDSEELISKCVSIAKPAKVGRL